MIKSLSNLFLPFTEDNIALVKQQVFEYVSNKTFIKDIELKKLKMAEFISRLLERRLT